MGLDKFIEYPLISILVAVDSICPIFSKNFNLVGINFINFSL